MMLRSAVAAATSPSARHAPLARCAAIASVRPASAAGRRRSSPRFRSSAGLVAATSKRHNTHIAPAPPPARCLRHNGAAADKLPPRATLVLNGKASDPWLTKERLLADFKGAYTTARTVDGTHVLELSLHASRLRDSALAALAHVPAALASLRALGREKLRDLMRCEILAALQHLGVQEPSTEFQVTLLLTAESCEGDAVGRGFDFYTYVQVMPAMPAMAEVLALRAERRNPTIKDLQWAKDRQSLEAEQRRAGVHEVLMLDADGCVSEGLQTNFFAIATDGTLITAPDSLVLAGTIRKLVFDVAAQFDIPVRFESPSLREAASWDSCFICSTSRLVRPVLRLAAPQLGIEREFPDAASQAHRIEAEVKKLLRSNAEPLTEGGACAKT